MLKEVIMRDFMLIQRHRDEQIYKRIAGHLYIKEPNLQSYKHLKKESKNLNDSFMYDFVFKSLQKIKSIFSKREK